MQQSAATALVRAALHVRELSPSQAERDRAFFAMTPVQRAAAMWRSLDTRVDTPPEVNMTTLYRWMQRCPDEVPLIDGEFAPIAVFTPECADR